MRFTVKAALACSFTLFATVAPILAHHSFAAEYDSTKTVTVKGTINKLAWVNPHAYVYVDVKDASGKVTTWAFEFSSTKTAATRLVMRCARSGSLSV